MASTNRLKKKLEVTTQGSKPKHKKYVVLKPIKLEDALNGFYGTKNTTNQFDVMSSLLDKLESGAASAIVLQETCAVIGRLATMMKNELPKHKFFLTGKEEEEVEEDEGDVPKEMSDGDKQRIIDMLELPGQEKSPLDDEDIIPLDKNLILKTFPVLESTIYKLGRKLRLISHSASMSDSPVAQLMIYIAAIELLPTLGTMLRSIVAPLADVELTKSRDEANIGEKVAEQDLKVLLERIIDVLHNLNDSGQATMIQIDDHLNEILKVIENGQEEGWKASLIMDNDKFKASIQAMVNAVANKCDEDIGEIPDGMINKGDYQFTDEFGDTFRGTYEDRTVFLKLISFRETLSAMARRELQVEVDQLRKLSSDLLTDFVGTALINAELYLVWEFYDYSLHMALFDETTIKNLIRQEFYMTNQKIMEIAMQILGALEFLHDQGVIHQDLTTKNVLLKNDLSGVCVGDFCFVDGKREVRKPSHLHDKMEILEFGTSYRAPEALHINPSHQKSIYVYSSDIYSFGIILYELIEKKPAFDKVTYEKFKQKLFISQDIGPRRPNFSEDVAESLPEFVKDMLHACWQQKPEVRPPAGTLLKELEFQIREEQKEEQEDVVEEPPAEGEEPAPKRERSAEFIKWLPETTGVWPAE